MARVKTRVMQHIYKYMNKLLPIIILVILTVGCSKRKSELSDFNQLLHTPEYASGFSIKGADGYESFIIYR